ncbi:Ig-like domain-containing protein [Flavobacterium tegetincola]|uniref:Ig-like domain-containing protein n=1 Tax=Flavobacterium tegetincola TaxID=150172 RepID=UPI00042385A0|nr:hypothetical protein [Flavobacterium tegetincola]
MNIKHIIVNLFFLFFVVNAVQSQTINCTRELSSVAPTDLNNSNWVVPATGTTCVSTDLSIARLEILDGGTLIIKPGVTLTITNSIQPDNAALRNSTIDVYGELKFSQSSTIPMSTTLTVYSTGKVRVGTNGTSNLNLKGNTTKIVNNGTFNVGTVDFSNNSSVNTIDNQGSLTISGNMNIKGNTSFRNAGNLTINLSFNNNSNSVYVNCGTFNTHGFNLSGGKIYNSGTFTATGAINFGNSSAFFENYGTFNGTEIQLGGGGSYVYNSGNFTLSNNFQNDGMLKGPASGSNFGKFTLKNKASVNNGGITGNLTFINSHGVSSASNMFNNSYSIASTVVFGNCSTCSVVTSGIACLSPNGTPVTVLGAVADHFTLSCDESTTTALLANDTYNNGAPGSATTENVSLTKVGTWPAAFTLNANGTITIASGTVAGEYELEYRICDNLNSSNCDNAVATVTIAAFYFPRVLDPHAGASQNTSMGISSLDRAGAVSAWPQARKSGWIALEAKTKGFVLNRVKFANNVPVAQDGVTLVITNPIEGMMVYDTTNDCLKVYTTSNAIDFAWSCMTTQTCPQ